MRRIGAAFLVLALFSALFPGLFTLALAEDAGVEDKKAAPSYVPRESAHTGDAPRDVKIGPKKGAKVVVIPIDGTIDLGIAAFLKRAHREHKDAVAFVLDINTLGGRVDAAIQMRDVLLDSKQKTVAFVHPRAISAGALITLACDIVAVSSGASIGAATPIQIGEGGAKPVEEKMVSYFRTEMRTTAEAKGRRGDVAEAMVDSSVKIEGLAQPGKLLTLDTQGALKWKMADFEAQSVEAVLARVSLLDARVVRMEENWAEELVRFLTDPVVSGLLMSLGTLGILIELYTPGLGIAGVLGLLCISLFFGGHLLVNLAGLEEILLFVVGLGLLALELLVIPGFGVAGIAGIICLFAGLVLTLIGLPFDVTMQTGAWIEPLTRVTWSLILTVGLMIVALRFLPRTGAARRLILEGATKRDEGFVSAPDQARRVGQVGIAESDLRPGGVARFGEERVDVVSEGAYVSRGAHVRVVEVEGARIVVRAVADSETKA